MSTFVDVSEQVLARLSVGERDAPHYLEAIEQLLPSALRSLAEEISEHKDPSTRNLLQFEFTTTLTAGKAALTSLDNANAELIPRLPFAHVSHASEAQPLQPVPDLTRLQLEPAGEFGFYAVSGGNLHTKTSGGSLTGLTGTLTVAANGIPTLAVLPVQLEPFVIERVADALKGIRLDSETPSLLEHYSGRAEEAE